MDVVVVVVVITELINKVVVVVVVVVAVWRASPMVGTGRFNCHCPQQQQKRK